MRTIFTLLSLLIIVYGYSQNTKEKRKQVKKIAVHKKSVTRTPHTAAYGNPSAKDSLPRQTITEKRLNGEGRNSTATGTTTNTGLAKSDNKSTEFVSGISSSETTDKGFDTSYSAFRTNIVNSTRATDNLTGNPLARIVNSNSLNNGEVTNVNTVDSGFTANNNTGNTSNNIGNRNVNGSSNSNSGNIGNTSRGSDSVNNNNTTSSGNFNANSTGNNSFSGNNTSSTNNGDVNAGVTNRSAINVNDSTLNINTGNRNIVNAANVRRNVANGNIARPAVAGDTIYNVNTLTKSSIPTNSGAIDRSGQVQFGQTNWGDSRSTVGESQWTVPPPITASFNKEFPGHGLATWTRSNWTLNRGDSAIYTARYKAGDAWITANYNALGERIDLRTEMPYANAPQAIKSLISRQFHGFDITSFVRIVSEGRPDTYEIKTRSGRTISITNDMGR